MPTTWWEEAWPKKHKAPDPMEQYPTESQPPRAVSRYVRIVCDDCGHWFPAPVGGDGLFPVFCPKCEPMHEWYAGLSAAARDHYLEFLKWSADGVL